MVHELEWTDGKEGGREGRKEERNLNILPPLETREKIPSLSPFTADVKATWGNIGLERELESVWRDSAYKNGHKSCCGRNALLLALSVPQGALNLNQKPFFMNKSRNRHD